MRLALSKFGQGPAILITHPFRQYFQRKNQMTGITAAALPRTQMHRCGPLESGV